MKYYLRDDLRYDYKKISLIYKAIIAILLAICLVLIIVISINDRAMKNNLILNASKNDTQMDSIGFDEQESTPEEVAIEPEKKPSFMNRIGNELKSFVNGEKSEQIKAYFSNAFRTIDAEDTNFLISKENCWMNYLSFKYEDNDFSTVANETVLRNEEQSSNTERYLYLIKYKYKENYKNDYNYKKTTHIKIEDNLKDNSLKTLTVLSS